MEPTPAQGNSYSGGEAEFAEPIPEYLRCGYAALMARKGDEAIAMWEALFSRYPSAEICSHLSRAHYYQIYFLDLQHDHARHVEQIRRMREWAERALLLNPNSSMGHAMYAAAVGREAVVSGSQKQVVAASWQVLQHADRAIAIDNNWIGHYVLGAWHREIAAVNPGRRTLVKLLQGDIPKGSYEKAIEHFQEVLRQYPANNTIYADIAYTFEAMADTAKACQMLERCLNMPLFKHPIAADLTRRAQQRLEKIRKRSARPI